MLKSWLKPLEGIVPAYYPLYFKKINGHAIYLPGVDRFLLADTFDPWITLEVAEILSSKVPTQVIILGEGIPGLSNLTVLEHTIKDKTGLVIHGANILVARQTPLVRKIQGEGSVINVGWSDDYTTPEKRAILLKLQEYGLFCLRICHALKITESMNNIVPHKKFMEDYFPGMVPQDFTVPIDQTDFPQGLAREIKQILYMSNSPSEAISDIEKVWLEYSQAIPRIRETFYKIAGLEMPASLSVLALKHNFTVRAV